MSRLNWILSLALVGLVSAAPVPATAPSLELELTCDKTAVGPGEPVVFTAHLVNKGKKPVTVVQPGDGSDCGWRTPLISWDRARERERGRILRCGNINALKPAEVVDLAPGKRLKLEWVGQPSLRPGMNKVAVEYEHVPGMKWKGLPLGTHDPAAMEKIRESVPIKLTSNVVEITVREK
jgi:hypothetical protein